jgi:hypothetical protein
MRPFTIDPERTERVIAVVGIVPALVVLVGAVAGFATLPGAEIRVGLTLFMGRNVRHTVFNLACAKRASELYS